MSDFVIQSGEFEGPMDLLLTLIERRKMHVSDVSLAAITESYLDHLEQMREQASIGQMADFVLVAATLMLIKSIALLPTLPVTSEEHASMEELEQRLKEYSYIRERARVLAGMFEGRTLFSRGEIKREPTFKPPETLTLARVRSMIASVVVALPLSNELPRAAVSAVIRLEEVISSLGERVRNAFAMSFCDFVGAERDRSRVVVSFLALLELVRRGAVAVHQEVAFADIKVETQVYDVPRYF